MKHIGLFLVLSFCLIGQGCKKKYVQVFEYAQVVHEICALKPQAILDSDQFAMFDIAFFYANGNANDQLTHKLYQQSINNLNDRGQKYIFCINQQDMLKDYLETQIQIELIHKESVQSYEFINYSCVQKKPVKLNLDKREAFKLCD
ncbi:hypothetical protein [Acinetobacter sp.]|jgi:hypothetical protein|uniref:hypothetical protein n=1 Tax=Acinetobacter sp. TaxID=472 RepID=UPI00281AF30F|nr:hypothetical protein [Acinetobacter sp.]MDR0236032.1 hypothetical protein [Acinetobacter sp.]